MTKIKINHTLDFEIVPDNKFTGTTKQKIIERSKCRFLFALKKRITKNLPRTKIQVLILESFVFRQRWQKIQSENGFEKHCFKHQKIKLFSQKFSIIRTTWSPSSKVLRGKTMRNRFWDKLVKVKSWILEARTSA